MVPGEAADQNRRLVEQVWVELVAAEPDLRGVQGRVRQLDTRPVGQSLGLDAGDLLGQPEILTQADVPGHRASRSSSTLVPRTPATASA